MKIKIKLPDSPPLFESNFEIRVTDLNYGSHMGNQYPLVYAHELRMKYLKTIDQSELNFFGDSLIMLDSAVQYLSQGHFDDSINASLWCTPLNNFSFDLYYLFSNSQTTKKIAIVKSKMAIYDYKTQSIVKRNIKFEQYIGTLDASF